MAKIKVEVHKEAVSALLRGPEVRRDVEARAHRIAAAAGGAPDFEVVTGTTDRAHASAVTASTKGRRAEAENRALTRAIDAGR